MLMHMCGNRQEGVTSFEKQQGDEAGREIRNACCQSESLNMNLLTFPPPHHFKTIMNCAWKRIKGTSAEIFLTPLPCSIPLVQYNDRNVCITKSHQMWLTFTVIVTLMIGIFLKHCKEVDACDVEGKFSEVMK